MDFEGVPEDFDFFSAEALDLEEGEDVGREFVAEGVVIIEAAAGGEGGDFFGSGLADAFHGDEAILGDELFKRLGERFEGLRGMEIGAGLEGILAFEFEKTGDVFEDGDDFVPAHRV